MLSLKHGVQYNNNKAKAEPVVNLIIQVVNSVFDKAGYDCIVTSIVDGRHSANSLHYRDGKGRAVDFRTRHLPDQETKEAITRAISDALGPEFDVVLESDHVHVEYDPD